MESFQIRNIKSFADSNEIKVKPITILVGKNSCGKSSLLRFPAVLAQTANETENITPISLFGENIDYGNYEDVVHGRSGEDICFSLTYKVDLSRQVSFSVNGGERWFGRPSEIKGLDFRDVTLSVSLGRPQGSKKTIKVHRVEVDVEGAPITILRWDDNRKCYELSLLAKYENSRLIRIKHKIIFNEDNVTFEKFFPVYENEIVAIAEANGFDISDERLSELRRQCILMGIRHVPDRSQEYGEEELKILQDYSVFSFGADIMTNLYNLFLYECKHNISYIGPFRQNPGRIYRNSEVFQSHVGSRGENVGDILINAYRLSSKNSLYSDISKWLEAYFGYTLDIKDIGSNYFQLMLQDQNGLQSNIIDVGFGISQVIPIISEMCLISNKPKRRRAGYSINNIVLVEQPELHLHPAAQASLADLFAMSAVKNPNARLIVETHSEHLIRKLEVLVASKEHPITSDMVQILYIDKDADGNAFIEEMKILPNGKFEKPWPSGFFDQAFQLSVALNSANK